MESGKTHRLFRDELIRLEGDVAGRVISCRKGILWLTQTGNPGDHLIRAGEAFFIERGGVVLISALEESACAVSGGKSYFPGFEAGPSVWPCGEWRAVSRRREKVFWLDDRRVAPYPFPVPFCSKSLKGNPEMDITSADPHRSWLGPLRVDHQHRQRNHQRRGPAGHAGPGEKVVSHLGDFYCRLPRPRGSALAHRLGHDSGSGALGCLHGESHRRPGSPQGHPGQLSRPAHGGRGLFRFSFLSLDFSRAEKIRTPRRAVLRPPGGLVLRRRLDCA